MQDNQNTGRYFSQEELDAIVNGQVTPQLPGEVVKPQEGAERPVFDTADTLMAVPRGVTGFGKSVYNLADWATYDLLPDWHTNPFGTSKSTVGGFVEGLSQVVTGFATGGLALRAASAIPGAVGSAAAWLGGSGGGTVAGIRSGLAKGAFADFVGFEANAGRLSDLLTESDNPILNNAVTQYLSTDMEDGELEGRLKNALEGSVLGVALEGVVAGIKGSAKAVKTYRAMKAAGAAEDDAVAEAARIAGKDLKDAEDLFNKAEFDEMPPTAEAMSFGRVDPDASVDDLFKAFEDADNPKPPTYSESYPVKRGGDAMIDRINREVGQAGGITAEEGRFMSSIIERMGVSNFEDMGIRFRKLRKGADGTFDFIRNVINISRKAEASGNTKETFVHEVWHSLTEYLDDSMLAAMKRDYEKAHVAFFDKYGVSVRDGVSGNKESAELLKDVLKKNNIPIKDWYKLVNLDEWVAVTLADSTMKRLALEADTKTVLGFLRYFIKNAAVEIKAVFGGAKYDKLAKDWLNGRYKSAYTDKMIAAIGGADVLPGRGILGGTRMAEYRMYGSYSNPNMAGVAGSPNRGVLDMRTKAALSSPIPPSAIREINDLINSGAGIPAIAARIDALRAAGVINLRPVVGSGTNGAYAEALIAIRQADGNPRSFGPAKKGSNRKAQMAAMAQLEAAAATGGINAAEMAKLMQDGVASAEELYKRLPFFLGLEASMRHQAVQALRAGRAETPEFLQAFTLVSGASRRIKSYLGKNLQMVQAFGDMESIQKTWNSLSPSRRKVLMNQYADALELLVTNPETGKQAAKMLTENFASKGGRIGAELFRNSILSGPKTLAVNVWSGVQMLAMPLERGIGRTLAKQGDQAAKEIGTMSRYFSEVKDAFHALKVSFREEGDSVLLGRGTTQYGEFQPGRAISSRNFTRLNLVDTATGGVRRTTSGLAVDFVGQVVNAPMRAMGSSDEFFTTLMARSEADVVLRRIVAAERKLPMTSRAVSSEVERLKQLLFVDGQLYTRKTTVEKGMRLARDKYLPGALRETLADSVAAKMGLGVSDPAVQAEASRLFGEAMSGGRLKPMSEIRKSVDADALMQSIDAAGQRVKANRMFIPEVQRYVDQNWDAYVDDDFMPIGGRLQNAVGQDYKILQKASGEIERRVKEATWKRDYDDMAESAVFGTRVVGNVGKATASAVSHVPVLQLVVPFIRTPTNLLAFVTDRNPIGRTYDWWQAARAGDKDAMAEAAGRLSTGAVLYSVGVIAAANGMLTGRGPKEPELRKQLLASGWQPYSFRFGDTYVSYGRNDPAATFLGLVADAYEIAAQTYDPSPEDQGAIETLSAAIIGSVANNVTNKSYLRGIMTTLGALTGDEAEQNKLKRQYAGALVPNFLAQSETYLMDNDIREIRSMTDAIQARLPFYGDSVDKVRDPLGDPIKGNETWWSMFLPVSGSRATQDPLKRELAQSLISVGSPRRTLPGGIDLKAIRLKSGQSAYDRLQELTGQTRLGGRTVRDQLSSLIRSPFYQGLPQMGQDDFESPRVKLVRGHVSNYRRAAMQQLMLESPELAQAVAHSREVKAQMLR